MAFHGLPWPSMAFPHLLHPSMAFPHLLPPSMAFSHLPTPSAPADTWQVLRGVLSLVRKHRVSLDANYMTLVMNVLCLEGMAGALLPKYAH